MIILHQFEISPFCDKVRRILHVKRQPYRVEEVPLGRALRRVRRLNPSGKLPILEHDGRIVCDSTNIAHYLEEQFPEPPLLPADPVERGRCHVLEDWADESLYFYEMRLRFTFPHNAKRWVPELVKYDGALVRSLAPALVPRLLGRSVSAQGIGRKDAQQVVEDVARHVEAVGALLAERDWLVGDALSLADIAVFAQLFCIRGADEGRKLIEAAPAVAAWMERVDHATGEPA